jgi:hypothetical protein
MVNDFMTGWQCVNNILTVKLMNSRAVRHLLAVDAVRAEQLPEIGDDPKTQSCIFSLTKPTCCSMKRPGTGRAHRAGGAPGAKASAFTSDANPLDISDSVLLPSYGPYSTGFHPGETKSRQGHSTNHTKSRAGH